MIEDIASNDKMHDINTTTTIEFEGKVLFHYDAETHVLQINIEKDFLLDIGRIPVDLCFPVPGTESEHYCFKKVSKVVRLESKIGLIRRFSRFIRRK